MSEPGRAVASRPLAGLVALRRAREASTERAALAVAVVVALTASGFAGYAITHRSETYDVRAVLPAQAGPFAWKRGVTPVRAAAPDLDPTTTGALPERPVPASPERPEAASAGGYVLRRVSGGVALLEGEGGIVSVSTGGDLPGAGRVLAIRNTGAGWVVITTETIIGPSPL